MNERRRITVRGPDVTGEISAEDLEAYLVASGWELRGAWYVRGQGDDERLVPAPRGDIRPGLEEVLLHVGTAERRSPGEVLRDVEARQRLRVGDVVVDEESPERVGIVVELLHRSMTVVWEDGGRSGGPGLGPVLRRREPRAHIDVGPGMTSDRWSDRQQAVGAALAGAGIRPIQGARGGT